VALDKILSRSSQPPAYVVLLHLSEDCNSVTLAQEAASRVLNKRGVAAKVLVTRARHYCGCVDLGRVSRVTGRSARILTTPPYSHDLFDCVDLGE
jgi:hypothetical protein